MTIDFKTVTNVTVKSKCCQVGILKIKMSTWRMAGLNYVNYSNIAARTLRKSLKSNLKEDAAKRDQSFVKIFYWMNGTQLAAGEKIKTDKEKT